MTMNRDGCRGSGKEETRGECVAVAVAVGLCTYLGRCANICIKAKGLSMSTPVREEVP